MLVPATASAVVVALSLLAPASAQDGSRIVTPQEIEWGAGPASLPAGAQGALLYGDPGKEGPFALRLRLPKGYAIPPHSHPMPEIVTVISGTFRLGMGETSDPSKARPLPAGSFFAMPPGMNHFASNDEETIVQLNSVGPWNITYVDPKDDPRRQTQ
ncbi:MAG: cupin domain-containing protein [Hyphomicrobiaceae bacterium]|nr:cupin domain-containing protein [Hyphomicrobiaceae bacterium]